MYAVARSTSVARLDLWNSFVATMPPKITRAGISFFRSISFTKSGFSRFTPRENLDASIAQIQQKFDALLAALREHDPEQYLTQIDEKLTELATRIGEIAPSIALQPVQDVIDDVKAQIAGFDLAAQIAPLQQVFDDAIAAMQAYSPGQLIEPLQVRVTEARQKVTAALRLDQWAPALDTVHEQAGVVLALIDPAQLERKLTELLEQARDLTANLPDVNSQWLGTVIAACRPTTAPASPTAT